MYDKACYERNREKRIASSRKWQKANPSKVNAAKREWRERNPEKAKLQSKRWRASNPEKRRNYAAKWNADNREKRQAHSAVQRIPRQNCEVCGNLSTHRHHDDYTMPRVVRFLCARHHKREHLEAA